MFYFRNFIRVSHKLRYIIIPTLLISYYLFISLLLPNVLRYAFINSILKDHTYDIVVFYDSFRDKDTYLSLNGVANFIQDEKFINTGLYMILDNMTYEDSPFKDYVLLDKEVLLPVQVADQYNIKLNQEIFLRFNNTLYPFTVKYIIPTTYDFDPTTKREGIAIIPYNSDFNTNTSSRYINFTNDDDNLINVQSQIFHREDIIHTNQNNIIYGLSIFAVLYVITFLTTEFILNEERSYEYQKLSILGLKKSKLFIWIYTDLFLRYQLFFFISCLIFILFQYKFLFYRINFYIAFNVLLSVLIGIIISILYYRKVTRKI